jgi:hypothetical protein
MTQFHKRPYCGGGSHSATGVIGSHPPIIEISVDEIIGKLSTNKVFLPILPNHFLQSSHVQKHSMWVPPSVLTRTCVSSPVENRDDQKLCEVDSRTAPENIHALFNTVALAMGTHANDRWIKNYLRTKDIRSIIYEICNEFRISMYVLFNEKGVAVEVGDAHDSAVVISIEPKIALVKRKDTRESVLVFLASVHAIVPSDAKACKKFKVAELRDMCVKASIPLDTLDPVTQKTKKKLKDELITDLEAYFKKLNTTLFV